MSFRVNERACEATTGPRLLNRTLPTIPNAPLTTDPPSSLSVPDKSAVSFSKAGLAGPISLTETPPSTPAANPTPPVNLGGFLQGFRSGSNLSVGATGFFGSSFVGGEGRVSALSPERIAMNLHVTAPGVDERLNIDLQFVNGRYELRSPEQWNANVTRSGNRVTITNSANANQRITVSLVRPGEAQIDTRGMGFDGKTLVIRNR